MMSKKDLIRDLAQRRGYTIKQADEIVSTMFEELTDIFSEGKELTIFNFGKFEIVRREARKGRNPSTGEIVEFPAKNVLKFKPGSQLKEAINSI